eukprot:scaffold4429_cov81-Cyclotella_meneghiniana.AAC.6
MAMVEVPGGSAIGGRSNHGRRTTTTPFFLEGRLEKAERRAGLGKTSPNRWRGPRVSQPLISWLGLTFNAGATVELGV